MALLTASMSLRRTRANRMIGMSSELIASSIHASSGADLLPRRMPLKRIAKHRIDALAKQGEMSRRLQTMPGVGAIGALAVETFSPPMETFKCGRDFAAWLGLVPLQKSTGGKPRLGKVSKMGQRDIRRLLIVGAMAVVQWVSRKGAPEGSWLARMIAKKPRMLVAIALANKMARGIWAMLTKQEDYRNPAGTCMIIQQRT